MRTGTESKQLATTSSQRITLTGHFADLQKPNLKVSKFIHVLSNTDKQSMTELTNIYYQNLLAII